ncbi:hypothetical protein, partial [Sphingomonas sp.]|uniref:hypothetical protein n=1 Tax=Sphingomonas sp. TaxID=28214 RepID=UPI00325FB9DF
MPAVISGQIARRRFIARALIMLLPFLGPVAPSFAALPASAPPAIDHNACARSQANRGVYSAGGA